MFQGLGCIVVRLCSRVHFCVSRFRVSGFKVVFQSLCLAV